MRSSVVDTAAGLFSLFFAAIFFAQSGELEGVRLEYPLWLIGFITLGGVCLLLHGLFKKRSGRDTAEDKEPVAYSRVGIIAAATILYALLIEPLGFYTTSAAFLFITALSLNDADGGFKKHARAACILTVVMCLAVWVGFSVLLRVPTPEGLFF